jgi:hypothetical protein
MRRLSARGKDKLGVLGYHRKGEVIGDVVKKEIDDGNRNSSGPRWEKVIEAKGLRLGGIVGTGRDCGEDRERLRGKRRRERENKVDCTEGADACLDAVQRVSWMGKVRLR